MSQVEIRITAEPVDNHRCKFVVSQPLHAAGVRRFTSPEEAKGSPLAESILAIPAPWQVVGKAVGAAIRAAAASGAPPVAAKAAAAGTIDDDALYERVARLFDDQVNPMVARHGGRVELIDVQDA